MTTAMTSKTFIAAAQAQRNGAVDAEAFKKAVAKLKRHMRAKFGCFDWQAEYDECGYGNVWFYYDETIAQPEGINTYNRTGDIHLSR